MAPFQLSNAAISQVPPRVKASTACPFDPNAHSHSKSQVSVRSDDIDFDTGLGLPGLRPIKEANTQALSHQNGSVPSNFAPNNPKSNITGGEG